MINPMWKLIGDCLILNRRLFYAHVVRLNKVKCEPSPSPVLSCVGHGVHELDQSGHHMSGTTPAKVLPPRKEVFDQGMEKDM